ncbi:MAG: hypothetical protein K6T80_00445 [Firmicutes bacterium]|nr:hypothetical protein [Bacillota bacterium]
MIALETLSGQLGLAPLAAAAAVPGRMVGGVTCSDLLSDVLSGAGPGNLLITSLTHRNVISVAVLLGLSAVIVTGGRRPEENAVLAAEKEGIPLFSTGMSNFETAGRVYLLLPS